MTKLALIVVLPLALLALPGILVVDVHEGGPDGNHIVVPVPLAFAHLAARFIPEQARHVECPSEMQEWAPLADRLVAELRGQPDFTLVEVIDHDEHVTVRKQGRHLLIDVESADGDQVHCRVPLRCAQRVLGAVHNGRMRTAGLAKALWSLPAGDLVRVRDGGDEIRIFKI